MNQAERYMELAARTEGRQLDPSYDAAFYLLSCEQSVYDAAKRYVDGAGISFEGLKRSMRGFDEISMQIVDIAHNLFKWTDRCKVTPFDISRMGHPYMEQVCHAICIASGATKIQIHEIENGELDLLLYDRSYWRRETVYNQMDMIRQSEQGEDMER